MTNPRITLCIFFLTLLLVGTMQGCAGFDSEGEEGVGDKTSQKDLNKMRLRYDFSIVDNSSASSGHYQAIEPRLSVDFSFIMPSSRVFLQLPNRFLRKERLYERLENLEVAGGNASLSQHERPEYKILDGQKDTRVTLRYLIRPSPLDRSSSTDSFSAPIIHRNFFMFVGQMGLILPSGLSSNVNEFTIELNWDLPEGFETFNSFGAKKRHQKIQTSGLDLWDSVFIGGTDIRSQEIDVNGKPVIITFEGEWDKIPDAEFIDTVRRLMKTQRDTWRDNNFPYFLVNFLAMGEGCNGSRGHKFAGTAHKNSFRAYFPQDCELTASMKQLISHELMHNWIGKKIKMGEQRGHIDGKFLTEGWTDFEGRRQAYLAGVITQQEFFETLNRSLQSYQLSTERLSPLKRLVAHMYKKPFTNQDLEQLPYQQGEIMALLLNKKIKEASNFKYSLDDVIRDLLAEAEKNGGSKNFTPEEVQKIVDRYAPNAFEEEFSKIRDGTIPLMPPKLSQCSEPQMTDRLFINGKVYQMPRAFQAYTNFSQCEQWLR